MVAIGFSERTVFGQLQQQKFRIADNAGKKVVQVMGHTACQGPHRFHLFRSLKLGFNALFFGHIAGNAPKTDGV